VVWAGVLIVGGAWLGRPQNTSDAANDPQFKIKSTHT